jgi:hypothetical protein
LGVLPTGGTPPAPVPVPLPCGEGMDFRHLAPTLWKKLGREHLKGMWMAQQWLSVAQLLGEADARPHWTTECQLTGPRG